MSIFSSVKSAVSKVTSTVQKAATAVVSKAVAAVPKAISIATKAPSSTISATAKVISSTTPKATAVSEVKKGVAAAATAATLGFGGGAAIVKAVSSASLGAKVAIGAGTLVAGGAVASNPDILSKASNVPSGLVNVGSNIGQFSKEPTVENALNIIKENPVLVGTTALIGGGAVLKAAGIGGAIVAKELLSDDTQKIKFENPTSDILLPSSAKESVTPTKTETPMDKLPATVPVTKSSLTTRKRKKQAKKSPLSQNMRVNIYNQSKHLNTYAYRR